MCFLPPPLVATLRCECGMNTVLTARRHCEDPSISAIGFDRVVKGDEVAYTVTGIGLWDDGTKGQHVQVATSTCGGSDNTNALAGGDGVQMTGINTDRTSATVTFTLTAAAASAKFCMKAPTYIGNANYQDTSKTVTVIDITSITGFEHEVLGSYVSDATVYAPNKKSGYYTLDDRCTDH